MRCDVKDEKGKRMSEKIGFVFTILSLSFVMSSIFFVDVAVASSQWHKFFPITLTKSRKIAATSTNSMRLKKCNEQFVWFDLICAWQPAVFNHANGNKNMLRMNE